MKKGMRKMELSEMTVVITGAASGIGHALALGFLDDKARVVAVDRNPEGMEDLGNKGAEILTVDVSLSQEVDSMVQAAVEKTGRLDVLVNNAGVGLMEPLENHSNEKFERVIKVNLLGPYYGTRYALPVMKKQGFGRIINMVSRDAEIARNGLGAYGAAKAGLFALTRTTAQEMKGVDILVNGQIPGPTLTAMNRAPNGQDPAVVYPTSKMLATLPKGGPSGKVFWNEKEYFLFDPDNGVFKR